MPVSSSVVGTSPTAASAVAAGTVTSPAAMAAVTTTRRARADALVVAVLVAPVPGMGYPSTAAPIS